MSRRRHVLQNANAQVLLGAGLFIGAAYCVWDAYEGRGRRRPFAASLMLP